MFVFMLLVERSSLLITSLLLSDYDLVQAHHPDSAHSRLFLHAELHARSHSITAAYEVLRGKSASSIHVSTHTAKKSFAVNAIIKHIMNGVQSTFIRGKSGLRSQMIDGKTK
jgi:hypothetical protein